MSTQNPENSFNGIKKRSRSPSDETVESEKNKKRPNIGASTVENDEPRNLADDESMLNENNDHIKAEIETETNLLITGIAEGFVSSSAEELPTAGTAATVSSNASSPTVNQPIKASTNSSSSDNRSGGSSNISNPTSPTSSMPAVPSTTSAQIHMRCLIVTQDASIIIGKKGSHVNEIREKSGARVVVSESIPGNPERILNVSGPLDAVSKVGGASSSIYCARLFSLFFSFCT